jgi:hypothetical protein
MKKCVNSAVFTALTVAASAGIVLAPGAFALFSIIATVLFTFVIVYSDTTASRVVSQSVIAVVYIASVVILKDPVPGLLLLATFFPVGWAVGSSYLMKRNLNSAGAMSVLFGAVFLLAVFAVYALFSAPDGGSFAGVAESLREAFVSRVETALESAIAAQPEIPSNVALYSVPSIAAAIFSYIPAAIAIWYLACAAVSFAVLRKAQRAIGNDISFMGEFSDFRVSKAGAIVYFIASLISLLTMGSVAGTAALNFTGVMSTVLSYAGIALIAYILDFKNISGVFRRIIIVALFVIGILPIGISYILSLVGLVDSYLNIRERFMNSGH